MSYQSDTSSCSDDDSNTIDPTSIYTMEEFIAEQSILHNFLERIIAKIQTKTKTQQSDTSCHRRRERRHIARNHEEGHQLLVAHYFSEDSIYSDKQFRARYQMRRSLFLHIVHALGEWSPYFTNRKDASSRHGLSGLQKCTAAIRMLACSSHLDGVDKYVQIGQSTAVECLDQFAEGVIDRFGGKYLRSPTNVDMQHLLKIGEARGFPGMLGSIGCMHWEWKNCPVKMKRYLTHTDHGNATMILETVASQDLWIWHAFFGVVGSNNNINMLNQSQLFTDVLKGHAPQVEFCVSKRKYNVGYYLADELYPDQAIFVKTIPLPRTEKARLFARHQEEARKDVQRAVELLQSRFAITCGPSRFYQPTTLSKILQACIILHNMTVEDEKDTSACFDLDEISGTSADVLSDTNSGLPDCFADAFQRNATMCAQPTDAQLRMDLIDNVWQQFGPFADK